MSGEAGAPRADLPAVVARFAQACREAGLPAGPERAQRFARAIVAVHPRDRPGRVRRPPGRRTLCRRTLYHCALATLVSDPAEIPVLDRVFGAVFGDGAALGAAPAARGDPSAPPMPAARPPEPLAGAPRPAPGRTASRQPLRAGAGGPDREVPVPALASPVERLAGRDFDALSAAELRLLAAAMGRLRLATPRRRSRRTRRAPHGRRIDLRRTMRAARRTAGEPVGLARRAPRLRPRRLVVLCDISGSMEPYARALLQLLWCAAGVERAEVFTFATRLTRLTPAMARTSPVLALDRASRLAPDWSGGTRIGAAVRRFLDDHGARGMARGAVVLVVSDGWDTGDPAELGRAMARLRRLAHRVVWANPRTRRADYRPLAGGMAAAWPYCDAVVSAHSLDALGELVAALAGSGEHAVPGVPRAAGVPGQVQGRARADQ